LYSNNQVLRKYSYIRYLHLNALALLIYFFTTATSAHDAGNLNETSIDRTNDLVVVAIERIQQQLATIFQFRQGSSLWPNPEILRNREELLHLQEESELSLEYLVNYGINLQNPELLRATPRAGRTLSASQAVAVAISILDHTTNLESEDTFVNEIYNGGLSAYMYNLLGAHKDRMELYKELMRK
jgi:hypothetical protein